MTYGARDEVHVYGSPILTVNDVPTILLSWAWDPQIGMGLGQRKVGKEKPGRPLTSIPHWAPPPQELSSSECVFRARLNPSLQREYITALVPKASFHPLSSCIYFCRLLHFCDWRPSKAPACCFFPFFFGLPPPLLLAFYRCSAQKSWSSGQKRRRAAGFPDAKQLFGR
jgi:hypothetical protein